MSLYQELKRRNVFRVAIAYLALAWLLIEVASVLFPSFDIPDWAFRFLVIVVALGFVPTFIFSWAFEITTEGLKREQDVIRDDSITHITAKRLDRITIGIIAVAVALILADRFWLGPNLAERSEGSTTVITEPVAIEPNAIERTDKSIAVLPFVNLSEDPSNEFFSDGISVELLDLLGQIQELRVADQTSSFAFKKQSLGTSEIAKTLNVTYVLAGQVRKAGNQVRITTQLSKADDGYNLWSESYDRRLDDIFAIQDEIASAVVGSLKITLLGDSPKSEHVDPDAYLLYLQAVHLLTQGTNEGYRQSNALLKQALDIAPDYARAWDALSSNYHSQVQNLYMPRDEGLALAREATDKALAIDPYLADAHAGNGWRAMTFEGDLESAARNFENALSLEPTNEDILSNAASLLAALGRIEESCLVDEYLAEKDPIQQRNHNNLSVGYLYLGRADEALATTATLLMLNPGRTYAHLVQARALLLKGENGVALEAIQKETSEYHRLFGLVVVYHSLGRKLESDAALAEFIAKYEETRPYTIASSLAFRGEADRAFEWLEKAAALDTSEATWNLHDPMFSNIHDDPRWLPFLESIGMSPAQLGAIEFNVIIPGR
jgi:TolB-like protein/Tfp pilus assembly protein PilF